VDMNPSYEHCGQALTAMDVNLSPATITEPLPNVGGQVNDEITDSRDQEHS
jgi:hypothetical protein